MSLVRLVLAISCPLLTKLANIYLYFSESEDEHPEKGVDGEIVDNEEQPSLSQSLPPTKKLRSTRQARQNPKPMLEANISGNKEDSFTCQKEGCPSYGHLFPSKDGYNKHCR